MLKPGDAVVYQISKVSTDPGPRAKDVHPAAFGETYSYIVDKYWTVAEIQANGNLVLVTRRGKRHVVSPSDPCLRSARWWERWIYRERFPKLASVAALDDGQIPNKTRA
jgi:hypothetical protein